MNRRRFLIGVSTAVAASVSGTYVLADGLDESILVWREENFDFDTKWGLACKFTRNGQTFRNAIRYSGKPNSVTRDKAKKFLIEWADAMYQGRPFECD